MSQFLWSCPVMSKMPDSVLQQQVEQLAAARTPLHMPGHKGRPFLGPEPWDITEIPGADSLYEAEGILAESEANAASLFGAGRTLYSAEGSSQCIRAMVRLAISLRASGTLPVIAAGVWAMTIVDTVAYRTEPYAGMQKKNEFVRIVGGYIFAVILTVISVIFAVMGEF